MIDGLWRRCLCLGEPLCEITPTPPENKGFPLMDALVVQCQDVLVYNIFPRLAPPHLKQLRGMNKGLRDATMQVRFANCTAVNFTTDYFDLEHIRKLHKFHPYVPICLSDISNYQRMWYLKTSNRMYRRRWTRISRPVLDAMARPHVLSVSLHDQKLNVLGRRAPLNLLELKLFQCVVPNDLAAFSNVTYRIIFIACICKRRFLTPSLAPLSHIPHVVIQRSFSRVPRYCELTECCDLEIGVTDTVPDLTALTNLRVLRVLLFGAVHPTLRETPFPDTIVNLEGFSVHHPLEELIVSVDCTHEISETTWARMHVDLSKLPLVGKLGIMRVARVWNSGYVNKFNSLQVDGAFQ